jgi:dihydrofolate reductase
MGAVILNSSVSLDGFSAGPDVSVEHGMGVGGMRLHEWLFSGDPDEADAEVNRELAASTGAVVIGRTMFDVGVGHWQDTTYPVPTIVLTHEALEPRAMRSATFTFVADGVDSAIRQAREAAGDANVLVMGGANVAQQCLRAGLADEVWLQVVPVLLGTGTRYFDHLDTGAIELERVAVVGSARVTHLRYKVVK